MPTRRAPLATRAALLALLACASGCRDWQRFEPTSTDEPDVTTSDVAQDTASPPVDAPQPADDATPTDGAPSCGAMAQACCGAAPFCITGLACMGSTCQPCGAGTSACDNRCVDLASSSDHCGMCGNMCTGSTRCRGGVCR